MLPVLSVALPNRVVVDDADGGGDSSSIPAKRLVFLLLLGGDENESEAPVAGYFHTDIDSRAKSCFNYILSKSLTSGADEWISARFSWSDDGGNDDDATNE